MVDLLRPKSGDFVIPANAAPLNLFHHNGGTLPGLSEVCERKLEKEKDAASEARTAGICRLFKQKTTPANQPEGQMFRTRNNLQRHRQQKPHPNRNNITTSNNFL